MTCRLPELPISAGLWIRELSREAGLGILAEQFLGELQLEIDAGETLHQPVVNFAGNASPFFRDGGARFFDIQSIKGLIFVQGLLDVGRRADAGLDQAAT